MECATLISIKVNASEALVWNRFNKGFHLCDTDVITLGLCRIKFSNRSARGYAINEVNGSLQNVKKL